jgi:hypothetical protein
MDYRDMQEIGHLFVVLKKGLCVPETGMQPFNFAYARRTGAYVDGLLLTPHAELGVKYPMDSHPGTRPEKFHREQLIANGNDDFINSVFYTYGSDRIAKKGDRDHFMVVVSREQ